MGLTRPQPEVYVCSTIFFICITGEEDLLYPSPPDVPDPVYLAVADASGKLK